MKGDWIQTYTGKKFWPLDPRAEHICIEDIAHALSNACRYAGHSIPFYSVAQHSCLVARFAPDGMELYGLLHDAAEAYIGDMTRPLKSMLPEFKTIENRIMVEVCARFKLSYPVPAEIKKVDNALLATEQEQIMTSPPEKWYLLEPPLKVMIMPLFPREAEQTFLRNFEILAVA